MEDIKNLGLFLCHYYKSLGLAMTESKLVTKTDYEEDLVMVDDEVHG